MFSTRSIKLLSMAICALLSATQPISAAPASALPSTVSERDASSSFWMASIQRQGTVWGGSTDYAVFRNVMDYKAAGDGVTDDTEAINAAISDGNRCGMGCNSSTLTPAIVYFPPGKYLVSKPVQMFYYTQMIGDATDLPTIVLSSSFAGMAAFDSDVYNNDGSNWYINQNNFFRQVRNFVFDLTGSTDAATAIHWQVAQATSLQNLEFKMKEGSNQQGIFMDNGSGGFFSDLTFSGGAIGAFLGSQQFTSRNLKFTNCGTAIKMNWNWGWTISNITVSGGNVGVDMSNSPANQTVGSVVLSDSTISSTYGVLTAYGGNGTGANVPASGGTLVIDNVDMSGTSSAVWQNATSTEVLAKGKITAWGQGNAYDHGTSAKTGTNVIPKAPTKADSLLVNGQVFGRSKPQYENVAASNIISAKSSGCKGDGTSDDTTNVQNFLNKVAGTSGAVAYFDHGAYLVKDTIKVPSNIKITGEIWPLIVADSASFNDQTNPKAVFQVGTPGDSTKGAVEISDLIFETNGPAAGAIMIEWNLDSDQGDSGMWDSHVRIGGSYGTNLQKDQCPGNPTTQPSQDCYGVFLMFHATNSSGGVYLENDWFWVADHDLEDNNQTQISIYSGRGALFNSQGPVWLWGTASEHSIIYQYQLDGVKAFFGGFMQTETPYFQPAPVVPTPLSFNSAYDDPNLAICTSDTSADGVPCKDAWGMRIVQSSGVLIYSTGMYSFFQNYAQACVMQHNCQENMIGIQESSVDMYAVTTLGAINMIQDQSLSAMIPSNDNRNVYGDTMAFYSTG